MSERNSVILKFNSNFVGEKVRLTIPRANTALTGTQVETTMNNMIQGGIIMTANGYPDSIYGAELVTTSRTPLMNA